MFHQIEKRLRLMMARLIVVAVVICASQAYASTVLNCTITDSVIDGRSTKYATSEQWVEVYVFDEEKQTLREASTACSSAKITPDHIYGWCRLKTDIDRTNGQFHSHGKICDGTDCSEREYYGTCRKAEPKNTRF